MAPGREQQRPLDRCSRACRLCCTRKCRRPGLVCVDRRIEEERRWHDDNGVPTNIELTAGASEVWLDGPVPDWRERFAGLATWVGFLVDDIASIESDIRARGHEPPPPVDREFGVRMLTIEDPEGHQWSFVQRLDRTRRCRRIGRAGCERCGAVDTSETVGEDLETAPTGRRACGASAPAGASLAKGKLPSRLDCPGHLSTHRVAGGRGCVRGGLSMTKHGSFKKVVRRHAQETGSATPKRSLTWRGWRNASSMRPPLSVCSPISETDTASMRPR